MIIVAKILFTILLFIVVEISVSKLDGYFISSSNGKLVHKFIEAIGLSVVFFLAMFLILR